MMKKLLSVFISVILMTGFVIGCAAGTEKPVIVILSADEIPAREWQKTAVFPDWKGYTDDTCLSGIFSLPSGHNTQSRSTVKANIDTVSERKDRDREIVR
jgi:hypothetical protein